MSLFTNIWNAIVGFAQNTGIAKIAEGTDYDWRSLVMIGIAIVLFYLAIVKKFEPLLLLPIAFGMLLTNFPGTNIFHMEWFVSTRDVLDSAGNAVIDAATGLPMQEPIPLSEMMSNIINKGGLLDFLYLGVKLGIYPSIIFLGIGAMTDFTPLIANPKTLFLGAAAQFGVFAAFFGALLLGFAPEAAAAIGIIGGADGPTAILVTKELAPHLLGAIAIAAYSYMALIPLIQPIFMRLLTTKKERSVVMPALRPVSKFEKIAFPVLVTIIVVLLVPDAAPLVGFLMFGNLLNVCGVTDRLSKTAQDSLINIVTIMLGVCVGATASADRFLTPDTLKIIVLGLSAFILATCGGLLCGKLMYFFSGGKINPLIGSAGVSAVPMAARVSQDVGHKENPANFLLMHAMGPNVAGVIGSAVAAGVFLQIFK